MSGLRLHVASGPFLLALPAGPIERLLLLDEARLEEGRAGVSPPACLGRLAVGPLAYSAWDLAILLGHVPRPESWVLLRVPRPAGPLPLALRTGSCVAVGALPDACFTLPPGLGRTRPGLFDAAFSVAAFRRLRGEAEVGLSLQLPALLREEELAHAEAELRREAE